MAEQNKSGRSPEETIKDYRQAKTFAFLALGICCFMLTIGVAAPALMQHWMSDVPCERQVSEAPK